MRLAVVLLVALLGCPKPAAAQRFPTAVLFTDYSADKYYGVQEYAYELRATGASYELYQTYCRNNDSTSAEKKRLGPVPRRTVRRLLGELDHRRTRLTLADLGLAYADFTRKKAFAYCRPFRTDWTDEQVQFTRAEVAKPANVNDAIERLILRKNYAVLHRSGQRSFTLTLVYADHRTTLTASAHPLGMPWHDQAGTPYYNPGIARLADALLPVRESANRAAFRPRDFVPLLIEQVYQDRCVREVDRLTWRSYQRALAAVTARYPPLGPITESSSYDWQWNGEHRLYFPAADSTLRPGLVLGVSLALEGPQLFPADSLLANVPAYLQRLQQVPFLMQFLAEHPARRLELAFSNTRSVTPKLCAQLREEPPGRALPPAALRTLERAVACRLTDEDGRDSVWLITPALDVFLLYYFGKGVYRYSDADLGKPTDHYHVNQAFRLDGTLRP